MKGRPSEVAAAKAWQTTTDRTGKAARQAISDMGFTHTRQTAHEDIERADSLAAMLTQTDCERRGHHAWTWKRDDGYEQVCDDCGIERTWRAEPPVEGQRVAGLSDMLNDALRHD